MRKIKSFIALALAVLLCMGTLLCVYANSEALFKGDADTNGTVNVKDATAIQKYVAGMAVAVFSEKAADADESDDINVRDATLIQKFTAGFEISHPVGEEMASDVEPGTTVPGTSAPTQPQTTAPADPVIPSEPVEKMDTNISIYFSNNVKRTTVNAYLYNEKAGKELAPWPGVTMNLHSTNDFGEQIYTMDVDVSEYNRIVFNNGVSQSMNAAVSVASSGFYIAKETPKSSMALGVYAFNESEYGNQTTVKLDYPDGYQKPITIWTPNGYDPADTTKKYPVIYLLDGQNQFLGTTNGYGGWVSDKIATCLQANGHEGFILVGIDNTRNRDKELTPDIGDVAPNYKNPFENGVGETFSNFVANTVKPYVEANYNASTLAKDNSVIGASSGGIEAFYIGMEHMDKFGGVGALSPAFMLFDKAEWDAYLAKFDFSDASKLPRIFFYNGGGDSLELELNPYAKAMPEWMVDLGYPADKVIFCHEDKFSHNEYAWRMVMPQIIPWIYELQ